MRLLRVLATVLALLVSGCGSEGTGGMGEREQAGSVVKRYFSSFARGEGTELCPLLTKSSAQDKMVEVVKSDERELGRSSTVSGCVEAVKFYAGRSLCPLADSLQ